MKSKAHRDTSDNLVSIAIYDCIIAITIHQINAVSDRVNSDAIR